MILKFPKGFLWGSATSALQIESAFDHDWKGLIAQDGSVLNNTIKHEKYRSTDVNLIASLGNAYRFSLDWSRLQRGYKKPFDKKVVKEYRDFIKKLKKKNVHIMLTLHHFANPNWFVKEGGWLSNKSVDMFSDYVKQVDENFNDLVDHWITINEPWVYAILGYWRGEFPPHEQRFLKAKKVLKHMGKAHEKAYSILKERSTNEHVGIAKSVLCMEGHNFFGKFSAKIADYISIDYPLKYFKKLDFLGVNYYGRIPFTPLPVIEVYNPGKLYKMGKEHDKMWEYYPQGITDMLVRLHKKTNVPIIITENGTATDDDNYRIKYIRDHLMYIHKAIKKGVPVEGYFHWSTFDNFELALGNSYRFGLVHVDFKSFKRTKKKSALYYSKIAKNNSLTV